MRGILSVKEKILLDVKGTFCCEPHIKVASYSFVFGKLDTWSIWIPYTIIIGRCTFVFECSVFKLNGCMHRLQEVPEAGPFKSHIPI